MHRFDAGRRSMARSAAMLMAGMLAALAGCSASPPPPAPTEPAPAAAPLGRGRRGHGCIPSAGYRWCERSARCERPWELAKAQGFENTAEAFERYCRTETTTGQGPS